MTVPHIQISNSNSSFEGSEEPVEVDPSESDSNIKQEMWMMGTNEGEEEDEEEGEFVIPPEQYEQDMQAEDEQYIQAGTEGLSGQQVGSLFNSTGDILSQEHFSLFKKTLQQLFTMSPIKYILKGLKSDDCFWFQSKHVT